MKDNKFYLPALDGLRFIAFLIVLHRPFLPTEVSEDKNWFVVAFAKMYSSIFYNGWIGVDLFFVLSSYLITTLLLKEHAAIGSINIKHFYIRRALRIWPLYFSVLFLVFIGPKFIDNPPHTLLSNNYNAAVETYLAPFLLFFGNMAIALHGFSDIGQLSILWTISAEEQFYFIWPLLLIFIMGKPHNSRIVILVAISLAAIAIRYYFYIKQAQYFFIYTSFFTRFDTFVIGGLAAIIANKYPNKIKEHANQLVAAGLFGIILLLSTDGFSQTNNNMFMVLAYYILAVFLSFIVLGIAHNNNGISSILSKGPLPYLGKISYGLYVLQFIGQYYQTTIMNISNVHSLLSYFLYIGISVFIITIIASISYHCLELPFLRLANNYKTIKNRPE